MALIPPLPNETKIPLVEPRQAIQPVSNEFIFPRGEDVKPYSGLPEGYRDQLLRFVMPQLQSSVTDFSSNVDTFSNNALGTYKQELQNYLKEIIPKQVGNLANRGILSSTVAENTLSDTFSKAATQSATKGYQTAQRAAELKLQLPTTLAGMLQYGMSSQDPTVMYRTLADLLASI